MPTDTHYRPVYEVVAGKKTFINHTHRIEKDVFYVHTLVCNCSARAYQVCKGFMTDCAIRNDDLQYQYLHKISMIYC